MGRLGDFLKVVYGPTEPTTTIRASLRQWRDRHLADNARGGSRTTMGRTRLKPDGIPQIEEATLSIWIASTRR